MGEKSIITTKNLAIGYTNRSKKNTLIENISIAIPEGKLTAIIGLNGAGKSTLIKTLARQQDPLEGNIFLNQKEATFYTNTQWATKIAWVQTNTEAHLNISVEEFISLGRQPYTNWLDRLAQQDIDLINKTIKETNLLKLRKKLCSELSDGQLQRVIIARALAQNTEIIILDEPTTHLDIQNKIGTLNLLKRLCSKKGKTIIFTTHEIEFALQVSDYILSVSQKSTGITPTQNAINSGLINNLFDSKDLCFDKQKKCFVVNP